MVTSATVVCPVLGWHTYLSTNIGAIISVYILPLCFALFPSNQNGAKQCSHCKLHQCLIRWNDTFWFTGVFLTLPRKHSLYHSLEQMFPTWSFYASLLSIWMPGVHLCCWPWKTSGEQLSKMFALFVFFSVFFFFFLHIDKRSSYYWCHLYAHCSFYNPLQQR